MQYSKIEVMEVLALLELDEEALSGYVPLETAAEVVPKATEERPLESEKDVPKAMQERPLPLESETAAEELDMPKAKKERPLESETAAEYVPKTTEERPLKSNSKYCIRYEGNGSKRWDGREILIDEIWMEDIYDPSELTVAGKELRLPWKSKKSVTYWNAVLVDPCAKSVKGISVMLKKIFYVELKKKIFYRQ